MTSAAVYALVAREWLPSPPVGDVGAGAICTWFFAVGMITLPTAIWLHFIRDKQQPSPDPEPEAKLPAPPVEIGNEDVETL